MVQSMHSMYLYFVLFIKTHTHLPVEVADLNNNKYFLYVFLLHDVNKLSKLNY